MISRLGSFIPIALGLVWLPLANGGVDPFVRNRDNTTLALVLTISALGCLLVVAHNIRAQINIVHWLPNGSSMPLLFLLGISAFVLISMIDTSDSTLSRDALLGWMLLPMLGFLIGNVSIERTDREILVSLLLLALFLQLGWSYFIWKTGGNPGEAQFGTFYAPNIFAGYILLISPVVLTMYLHQARIWVGALFLFATSAALLAIVFSGSRGGVVMSLIGSVVAVYQSRSRGFGLLTYRMALLVVVVLAGASLIPRSPLFPDGIQESKPQGETAFTAKLPSGTNSTVLRLQWWEGAKRVFVEHPINGSGVGTFGPQLVKVKDPSWGLSKYAHNAYLESLAEGGLGLAALLTGFVVFSIQRGWRLLTSAPDWETPWRSGLVAGLTAGGLHMAVDFDWTYPAFRIAFIAIAFLVVTHHPKSKEAL